MEIKIKKLKNSKEMCSWGGGLSDKEPCFNPATCLIETPGDIGFYCDHHKEEIISILGELKKR